MKIVCWGDYAIPVPDKAKWIAMDKDGTWYWYVSNPIADEDGVWMPPLDSEWDFFISCASRPKRGKWDTQLYWLEDM